MILNSRRIRRRFGSLVEMTGLAFLAGLFLALPLLSAGPKPASKKRDSKKSETAATSDSDDATASGSSIKLSEQPYSTGYSGSHGELIGFINSQVRQGWVDNNVRPAEPADDAEWVRRVHLDIVGHVPDLETVQKFLADKDKAKR